MKEISHLKILACGVLISVNLVAAQPFFSEKLAVRARADSRISLDAQIKTGVLELNCTHTDKVKGKRIGFAEMSLADLGNLEGSVGVQFEVKGSSVDNYGSIAFCAADGHISLDGYEVGFLVSEEWKLVTVYWDEFVQNNKPFGSRGDFSIERHQMDVVSMARIGWGRGFKYNNYDQADWSLSVRNVDLIYQADDQQTSPANYSKGLERTLAMIQQAQNLKILLLGDSITDFGDDRSYAFFMAERLRTRYGVSAVISNQGIGGHSVGGGSVVLNRSLSYMPDPDLVVIFYGANDAKATRIGLDAEGFQMQLEHLIDRVRLETQGKSDLLLVTGVPRLNDERTASTGLIEKIVDGIHGASQTRETGLLDTFLLYQQMGAEQWAQYYKDTVHQNEAGLQFIGEFMFEHFKAQI